jgi:hypothetical protein
VTEGSVSSFDRRLGDHLRDNLRSCSFTMRVSHLEAAGGGEHDWVCLSLRKALTFLCSEADMFREALLAAVRDTGGGNLVGHSYT